MKGNYSSLEKCFWSRTLTFPLREIRFQGISMTWSLNGFYSFAFLEEPLPLHIRTIPL